MCRRSLHNSPEVSLETSEELGIQGHGLLIMNMNTEYPPTLELMLEKKLL